MSERSSTLEESRPATVDDARAQIDVARQLEILREPPAPARLVRAATVGDGIEQIRLDDRELLAAAGRLLARDELLRFVPASGAASRMFGSLRGALDSHRSGAALPEEARRLIDAMSRLPFGEAWHRCGADPGSDPAAILRSLENLLTGPEGGLAKLPKALLPFHSRGDGTVATPLEEHLHEAAAVLATGAGAALAGDLPVRVHFTVAREHRAAIRSQLDAIAARLAGAGPRFATELSSQDPSTETIALDLETGEPARTADGSLLFRPGGHGALLANVEETGASAVVIKNIDNVLPAPSQQESTAWIVALTGRLQTLRERQYEALAELRRGRLSEDTMALRRRLVGGEEPSAPDPDALLAELDRPLRVCGVVENRGEPGGGPFWTRDAERGESLQIVESAQIDTADPEQDAIRAAATHFNPVLLLCSLRDERGAPYPLRRFVDPAAAFVTEKVHEGRALRVLEHPGLWNGAMARWLTVFVEIPASVFAPVKTVWDLLRPEHEPD